MRFSFTRNLPKTEQYVTNKKFVKLFLGRFELLSVVFGLRKKFELDSRRSNRPTINGPVVASVLINRSNEILASFYPVATSNLPADAVKVFNESILPAICKWIEEHLAKPDTAIVGIEQLIIAIEENTFRFHHVLL
jgi:hypothetical protein